MYSYTHIPVHAHIRTRSRAYTYISARTHLCTHIPRMCVRTFRQLDICKNTRVCANPSQVHAFVHTCTHPFVSAVSHVKLRTLYSQALCHSRIVMQAPNAPNQTSESNARARTHTRGMGCNQATLSCFAVPLEVLEFFILDLGSHPWYSCISPCTRTYSVAARRPSSSRPLRDIGLFLQPHAAHPLHLPHVLVLQQACP